MDEKMRILVAKIVNAINSDKTLKSNYENIKLMGIEVATLSMISQTISAQDTSNSKDHNIKLINIILDILNKNKISPGNIIEILYLMQIYIIEKYPELKEIADTLIAKVEMNKNE
ncbi:MAG: hypothetical protein QXH07_03635 [Thermoplasmata archaeon]